MEQNKPQTEQDLTQQAAVRRQKLADLRAAGRTPLSSPSTARSWRWRAV